MALAGNPCSTAEQAPRVTSRQGAYPGHEAAPVAHHGVPAVQVVNAAPLLQLTHHLPKVVGCALQGKGGWKGRWKAQGSEQQAQASPLQTRQTGGLAR